MALALFHWAVLEVYTFNNYSQLYLSRWWSGRPLFLASTLGTMAFASSMAPRWVIPLDVYFAVQNGIAEVRTEFSRQLGFCLWIYPDWSRWGKSGHNFGIHLFVSYV